ncbi:ribonuclease H-like domain-containing protein [Tanacetum coccineum]|uniref:Ribonuclease H-like domain-containing protein n=1 Tax=Tanacetum coccineum TaxID=301880 RepID=A0ABQ5ELN5_9ASTR
MMFGLRFSGPIKVEKDFALKKLKSLIQTFVEEDSSGSFIQDSLSGLRGIHGCGHADWPTDNHRIFFPNHFQVGTVDNKVVINIGLNNGRIRSRCYILSTFLYWLIIRIENDLFGFDILYGTSTSTIPGPVTTEEKDAKTLFEAIQTRFGGNDATKKTQKTLLKQIFENFNAPSTESLDFIFNRLQKIVSQLAILGENISQKDLNLKFLRILPSEWNTRVVVWRNKPDLDSMSFDDLYNNFKIVEQEVKRTVTSSSNSGSQNMAFVTTPSSTNEVNTANVQVSTANSTVSTDSTLDSTANLSDATVYAFLANQPNGSQLVHEDLEQIHEDDLEEMDLKWQLALLSMRARKYYQRTGKKITINGSDTAGYDKSKVECFNCHKMGHFARECRGPRNQESRARNQDSSRRTMNVEDISSKAMVAIDGVGFDWSYMADEEVPTNLALMAFSDSEVHNNKTCSNTCLKSFETLKTQLDNLRVEFNKSEFNLAIYKRGLTFVEEQLVFYKKSEVMFCDQIAVLKRDASFKDPEINALNIQIENFKKEKEINQIKINNFKNASKSCWEIYCKRLNTITVKSGSIS